MTSEEAQENLRKAVQDYINATAPSARMLDQAVVVYEDVGYDEDGETTRSVQYLIPTHNFSLAMAVGLCELGKRYIERDLIKVHVCQGDDCD